MQAFIFNWNSLEIVKIAISMLTPLLVLSIGFWISRRQKRLDNLQWRNQKLTEKRIAIFEKLAPLLNDVFCYFMRVGSWKEMEPPSVVQKKREMDQIIYVNRPLFSPAFFDRYQAFIETYYSIYTGSGRNAELRTSHRDREKHFGDSWKLEWNDCFADNSLSEPVEVESQYQSLMSAFAVEMGIEGGDDRR